MIIYSIQKVKQTSQSIILSNQNGKPEDHWSRITHMSAEDMLKSAVIEEKEFKHSPWAGVDNPLRPKFLCQQEGRITMVICCKFKKNLFNFIHIFLWFNKCI